MAEAHDYRTDSEYIFHYSDKLSPQYIRTSLLMEGVDLPARADGEPFRYLELGFGQGLSLNIHAAANEGEYWGTDFIPAHAERANRMAKAAGSDCTALCASFAEMDEMSAAGKLPQFDVVAFHGVLSWINDENHAHILRILDRNLKPGGAVYCSYNAMPGWAFFIPVRDLMVSLLGRYGENVDIKKAVGEIIDYLIAFADTKEAVYFGLNQRSVDYLKHLKTEPPGYVAQEFLNNSWRTFYFRQIAEDFEKIGCKFIASANPLHQSSAAIRPRANGMISQILNPNIRESLRDFALDRKFRVDYFVKSPQKITPAQQAERLGDCCVKLAKERRDIKLEVSFDYETITLHPDLFNPLLDRLNDNGRSVKTVRSVFGDMFGSANGLQTALECLRILLGGNMVRTALPSPAPQAAERCRGLNRELCREIFEGGEPSIAFLAAPVTGAGIRMKWEELLLLHTRPAGGNDPEAWARGAAEVFRKFVPGESEQAALKDMRTGVRRMIDVGLKEMDAYGVELK